MSLITFRQPYQVKLNGESSNCRNTVFFLFSSSLTVVAFFVAVEVIDCHQILRSYARTSFRSQGFRERHVNSPALCFFAVATIHHPDTEKFLGFNPYVKVANRALKKGTHPNLISAPSPDLLCLDRCGKLSLLEDVCGHNG